jgi:hypothetical protein
MADYGLQALAGIDRAYQMVGLTARTAALSGVGASFAGNVDRVLSLCRFPVRLLNCSERFRTNWSVASDRITGNMNITYTDRPRYLQMRPLIAAECEGFEPGWLAGVEAHGEEARFRLENTLFWINTMVDKAGLFLGEAVESTLSSMIVSMWTAFETFAGDLWVATLNAHPQGLARLAGQEKRIAARAGAEAERASEGGEAKGDGEKTVRLKLLHDLTRGTFDLSSRMGDLLKGRFNFSVLEGIRRAYSVAFDESIGAPMVAAVDGALAHHAIDALSAVRNLLVHRGGVADEVYVKVSRRAHAAPRLDLGQRLQLNGETVACLIDGVVASCLDLFVAIDLWLSPAPAA